MSGESRYLPPSLVGAVEWFITEQHADARKYDNRTVLDESGAFDLHRLAAAIFAAGFDAGERSQHERDRGQRARERDAERAAADESSGGDQ